MGRRLVYLRAWALPVVAAVLLVLSPNGVAADQTDPRLDRLFAVLHTSDKVEEVDLAQGLIWDIWITHRNQDITRMMRRGIFAMANRRNNEALEIFSGLITLDPNYAEAWNKRATLYFMMGDLGKSRADVERTLELEPRHFGALSGLGQIELRRGDREEALKAFEHALDTNPHLPAARVMIERLRARNISREL